MSSDLDLRRHLALSFPFDRRDLCALEARTADAREGDTLAIQGVDYQWVDRATLVNFTMMVFGLHYVVVLDLAPVYLVGPHGNGMWMRAELASRLRCPDTANYDVRRHRA